MNTSRFALQVARHCCLGIWLIVLSVSCGPVEERYSAVSEARREGLFARGWVPDVLPDQAGPIIERHDLDTNERCSFSQLPAEAFGAVTDGLRNQGFQEFKGELPEQPFAECTEIVQWSLALRRSSSTEHEYAVLAEIPLGLVYWAVAGD